MLDEILKGATALKNDSNHILYHLGDSDKYTVFQYDPKVSLDTHGFYDNNHMVYWAWESAEFKYVDAAIIITAPTTTPFGKIYTIDRTDSWMSTVPFKTVTEQYACEARLTDDGLCIMSSRPDPIFAKEAYKSLCKDLIDGNIRIYLMVNGKREDLIGDESISKMLAGGVVYHDKTANQMIIEEQQFVPGMYSFGIPIDMLFIKYRTAYITSADVLFNNRKPAYINTEARDGLLFAVVEGKLKVYQPFTCLEMAITNFRR